jgi:hypothetical protein
LKGALSSARKINYWPMAAATPGPESISSPRSVMSWIQAEVPGLAGEEIDRKGKDDDQGDEPVSVVV